MTFTVSRELAILRPLDQPVIVQLVVHKNKPIVWLFTLRTNDHALNRQMILSAVMILSLFIEDSNLYIPSESNRAPCAQWWSIRTYEELNRFSSRSITYKCDQRVRLMFLSVCGTESWSVLGDSNPLNITPFPLVHLVSKFQLQCSCVICKLELPIQSLKAHITKHLMLPVQCLYCSNTFLYVHNKKFCSQSCAAKHNNPTRVCRTGPKPGFRKGIKTTVYSKFAYCQQCSVVIRYSHNKTCSVECRRSQKSQKAKFYSHYVRLNRNPNKQSWMERSFTEWLRSLSLVEGQDFITEYKIHNPDGNRTYFADFYFPNQKLIIELDGSQHLNTIEQDNRRDLYISTLGISVYRISHSEYKKQTKLVEVLQLIGAGDPDQTGLSRVEA